MTEPTKIDISKLTPAQVELQMYNAAFDFAVKAREYVPAHNDYKHLENTKKQMFQKLCNQQIGETAAERERQALVSTEWGLFLDGLNDAGDKDTQTSVEKEIAKVRYEVWRSLLSSSNTERRTNT